MEHFTRSLTISEVLGDQRDMSLSLGNIGLTYKELGEYKKALEYYAKSLAINEELGDKRSRSISLINIAQIHHELKQYRKAISFAKLALELAKEAGAINQQKLASSALYESYKKTNEPNKALKMYELFIAMRDSLQREENEREVIRQEYKYNYEKEALADSVKSAEAKKVLDAQIKAQSAELNRARTQRYALFGGVLALLLFGAYTFNRFKKSQAQNTIIEHQKEIVEESHREITDSIAYAKRIQIAILPPARIIKKHLKQSFVLYKPKDVVAGDFYWLERKENKVLLAVADCTGHGVPGLW